MLEIKNNQDMTAYNTLRVKANAKYFVDIQSADDFFQLMNTEIYKTEKKVIIGGGSNILLTGDIDGLVIKNSIKGIEVKKEASDHRIIKVGGGELRHDFVIDSCKQGLRGIENLVLIPGSVGAAPMQNIGAYGQEVKDTIVNIRGFDLETGNIRLMNNLECELAYRSSIFKTELKDQFFITHVTFKLSKIPKPNLSYEKVKETLKAEGYMKNEDLTPLRIANAIMKIRESKLPNVDDIGTAGSFFKNPVIDQDVYEKLQKQFPNIIGRPATSDSELDSESRIKLSAGQLLDLCGCKGMEEGNIGTYKNHALVIVNKGEPDGNKLRDFAKKLQLTVKEKTGITIEPEVNII